MKKAYHAPALYYESFQLSQHISLECEGIANFEADSCSINIVDEGVNINIFQQLGICQYTGPGFEDMICYHAPSEMNNAFSS